MSKLISVAEILVKNQLFDSVDLALSAIRDRKVKINNSELPAGKDPSNWNLLSGHTYTIGISKSDKRASFTNHTIRVV